jgi:hypothetical protein
LWTRWWTSGFHKKAGCFLTSCVTISFSNNILHHGAWIKFIITLGVGVEMDVWEIGWKGVNRMHLAQDRDRWRSLWTW